MNVMHSVCFKIQNISPAQFPSRCLPPLGLSNKLSKVREYINTKLALYRTVHRKRLSIEIKMEIKHQNHMPYSSGMPKKTFTEVEQVHVTLYIIHKSEIYGLHSFK